MGQWLVYVDRSLGGNCNAIYGPSKLGDVTAIQGIWENGWYKYMKGFGKAIVVECLVMLQ